MFRWLFGKKDKKKKEEISPSLSETELEEIKKPEVDEPSATQTNELPPETESTDKPLFGGTKSSQKPTLESIFESEQMLQENDMDFEIKKKQPKVSAPASAPQPINPLPSAGKNERAARKKHPKRNVNPRATAGDTVRYAVMGKNEPVLPEGNDEPQNTGKPYSEGTMYGAIPANATATRPPAAPAPPAAAITPKAVDIIQATGSMLTAADPTTAAITVTTTTTITPSPSTMPPSQYAGIPVNQYGQIPGEFNGKGGYADIPVAERRNPNYVDLSKVPRPENTTSTTASTEYGIFDIGRADVAPTLQTSTTEGQLLKREKTLGNKQNPRMTPETPQALNKPSSSVTGQYATFEIGTDVVPPHGKEGDPDSVTVTPTRKKRGPPRTLPSYFNRTNEYGAVPPATPAAEEAQFANLLPEAEKYSENLKSEIAQQTQSEIDEQKKAVAKANTAADLETLINNSLNAEILMAIMKRFTMEPAISKDVTPEMLAKIIKHRAVASSVLEEVISHPRVTPELLEMVKNSTHLIGEDAVLVRTRANDVKMALNEIPAISDPNILLKDVMVGSDYPAILMARINHSMVTVEILQKIIDATDKTKMSTNSIVHNAAVSKKDKIEKMQKEKMQTDEKEPFFETPNEESQKKLNDLFADQNAIAEEAAIPEEYRNECDAAYEEYSIQIEELNNYYDEKYELFELEYTMNNETDPEVTEKLKEGKKKLLLECEEQYSKIHSEYRAQVLELSKKYNLALPETLFSEKKYLPSEQYKPTEYLPMPAAETEPVKTAESSPSLFSNFKKAAVKAGNSFGTAVSLLVANVGKTIKKIGGRKNYIKVNKSELEDDLSQIKEIELEIHDTVEADKIEDDLNQENEIEFEFVDAPVDPKRIPTQTETVVDVAQNNIVQNFENVTTKLTEQQYNPVLNPVNSNANTNPPPKLYFRGPGEKTAKTETIQQTTQLNDKNPENRSIEKIQQQLSIAIKNAGTLAKPSDWEVEKNSSGEGLIIKENNQERIVVTQDNQHTIQYKFSEIPANAAAVAIVLAASPKEVLTLHSGSVEDVEKILTDAAKQAIEIELDDSTKIFLETEMQKNSNNFPDIIKTKLAEPEDEHRPRPARK
jgi:hypothetical protein